MASTLLDALTGSLHSEEEDPLNVVGRTIGSTSLQSSTASPKQNLILGLGQALIGGLLAGAGKARAADQNQELIDKANDLMTADPEERLLIVKDNPRLSKLAIALGAEERQAMKEERAAQIKRIIDLQDYGLKEDIKNQGILEREKVLAPLRGKYSKGTSVNVTIPGQDPFDAFTKETLAKVGESDALISEISRLSDEIKQLPKDTTGSFLKWQGSKLFAGLDEGNRRAKLSNLVDRLGKLRSGAALNADEEERYQRLMAGDMTIPLTQVAPLLDKIVGSESRRLLDLMEFSDATKGGKDKLIQKYSSLAQRDQSSPSVPASTVVMGPRKTPPPGFELSPDGKFFLNPQTKQAIRAE